MHKCTLLILKCLYWNQKFWEKFMAEDNRVIELEITVKERTTYGISGKSFSDGSLKEKRALTIVQLIEYLAENYHDDYIKAVRILRKQKE